VLKLLIQGSLTFDEAYIEYNIKHLPRRIKDLQEKLGIKAQRIYAKNGTATYFLNDEQKAHAKVILEKLK
jgi:uncharacterized protein (UPF0216 family)